MEMGEGKCLLFITYLLGLKSPFLKNIIGRSPLSLFLDPIFIHFYFMTDDS